MQENQRLVAAVMELLEKSGAPRAADFKALAQAMLRAQTPPPAPVHNKERRTPAPKSIKSDSSPPSSKKPLRPVSSKHSTVMMSESDLLAQQDKLRRASFAMPQQSRNSFDSARSDSPLCKSEQRPPSQHVPSVHRNSTHVPDARVNLDYFPLGMPPNVDTTLRTSHQNPNNHNPNNQNQVYPPTTNPSTKHAPVPVPTEWEVLLGSLDSGQTNLYDAIYGGPPIVLDETNTQVTPSTYDEWSPESWDMSSLAVHDFSNGSSDHGVARSVLSFSDDSLSSTEDMSGSEGLPGNHRHTMIAATAAMDNIHYDGLEAMFGL